MIMRRNFHAATHLRARLLLVMLAAVIALVGAPAAGAATADKPIKIGIIGTGRIGGTLASHWAKAGHEVMLSSRHPEELKELADSLGRRARVGTPKDAAAFGEVVLISVPYAALPELGRDLSKELTGKVVLETGNPYPGRDGAMAAEARKKGTGAASTEFLPGAKLVRAFNAISYRDLQSLAHRSGQLVAIPIAGNDADALEVAQRLVRDAGFEPVVVGALDRAKEFDVGTPVYVKSLTGPELRKELGLGFQSAPPK
jgi:8-hydroxy-5-deazaflavin:NADPH oxidoreductase